MKAPTRKPRAGTKENDGKSLKPSVGVARGGMRKRSGVSPVRESKQLKSATALSDRTCTRRGKYVLHLYVTGLTPNSTRAITHIKNLCETHLKGRYDLRIIDIYQKPALAKGEQIIAAPTLIKKLPLPLRRLVGDLSKEDRVLFGLDLRPLS